MMRFIKYVVLLLVVLAPAAVLPAPTVASTFPKTLQSPLSTARFVVFEAFMNPA